MKQIFSIGDRCWISEKRQDSDGVITTKQIPAYVNGIMRVVRDVSSRRPPTFSFSGDTISTAYFVVCDVGKSVVSAFLWEEEMLERD